RLNVGIGRPDATAARVRGVRVRPSAVSRPVSAPAGKRRPRWWCAGGTSGRCPMDERDWLAGRFEESRGRLRAGAHRMLGSTAEADDAVQESWLRLSRAYEGDIANLRGWLTTVVGRVCLDMLRQRRARREDSLETLVPAVAAFYEDDDGPEEHALLADS